MSPAVGTEVGDRKAAERRNVEFHDLGVNDVDAGPVAVCRALVADPGCMKALAAADIEAFDGEIELPGNGDSPFLNDRSSVTVARPTIASLAGVSGLVEVFL